ncbi:twin-arginine translocase subunit TatC [Rubrobacter taiwanensis]|nr:twin-arginine translocase subunit TatC [Rubrobacter taiwanensis]
MTIVEHLDELRSRIIRVGIAFVAVVVVAWFFRVPVFNWLLAPAERLGGQLNFTGVTGAIMTDIKITLYVGLMLTLPWALYQAWAFVVPAVGEVGRAFTYTLVTLASLLFLAGAAFAYYFVLPFAMNFLIGWGGDRFQPIITGDAYLSFVMRFLLAFGIAFEVPAATYVGAKLGLITAPTLRRFRRHAIIVNAVVAAVLTPAEPFSMIMMMIPLTLLYEVSILIARYVNPVTEGPLPERFPGDEERA